MNDKIEFKTPKELYNRVSPALYSKVQELKRIGIDYVTEKDIWNYLADNIWKNKINLELHELINDILYVDNYIISEYVMNKLHKYKNKEKINLDNNILGDNNEKQN